MPTLTQRMIEELERDRMPYWRNIYKQEGEIEGMKKGELKEKKATVRNMLKENCSLKLISSVTGLSIGQINELRQEMSITAIQQ